MVHKKKLTCSHAAHLTEDLYSVLLCSLFSGASLLRHKSKKNFVTVTSDYLNLIVRVLQTQPGHSSSGSLYLSGKLPTYPSPKPTFCPTLELSVNVGLGER